MKKFLVPALLFLIASKLSFPLFAEEFNAEKARNDYLYNLEVYQQSHQEYVRTKQAYYTYRTLVTKTEAINTAVDLLLKREEMVRTYLVMLRLSFLETPLSADINKQEWVSKCEILEAWLESRKPKIEAVSTIIDINKVSEEFEGRFAEVTALSRQMSGLVLAGEMGLMIEEGAKVKDDAISQLKTTWTGDKARYLESFIAQIDEKISLALDKKNKALTVISGQAIFDNEIKDTLSPTRSLLIDSQHYLKEMVLLLEEGISE